MVSSERLSGSILTVALMQPEGRARDRRCARSVRVAGGRRGRRVTGRARSEFAMRQFRLALDGRESDPYSRFAVFGTDQNGKPPIKGTRRCDNCDGPSGRGCGWLLKQPPNVDGTSPRRDCGRIIARPVDSLLRSGDDRTGAHAGPNILLLRATRQDDRSARTLGTVGRRC